MTDYDHGVSFYFWDCEGYTITFLLRLEGVLLRGVGVEDGDFLDVLVS